MKNEIILNALGKVNDKYIEDAAPKQSDFRSAKNLSVEVHKKGYRKVKRMTWIKGTALVACLLLLIAAGIKLIPPNQMNLPMLTIQFELGGMGFEGYLAYDISQLDNSNPWSMDTQLDTLPVYQNTSSHSSGIPVPGIGEEAMLALAEQTVQALDMEILEITPEKVGRLSEFNPGLDRDDVHRVLVKTDATEIEVTGDGTVTVSFTESIPLPENYSFTYANTSDEGAKIVTDYLIQRFNRLLSFEVPQKELFTDYTYDGDLHRSYSVYDAAGNITEQILNYNFNQVKFAPDDQGNLMLIRIFNGLSCAQKIGDYPIISPEEAIKLLLKGNYLTSVPEEMPGEAYVMKTELVYRTGNINETFLPYYRFYVELPEMHQENGLKTYGAYYVPAIEQKYITNMPLWDGSFN